MPSLLVLRVKNDFLKLVAIKYYVVALLILTSLRRIIKKRLSVKNAHAARGSPLSPSGVLPCLGRLLLLDSYLALFLICFRKP